MTIVAIPAMSNAGRVTLNNAYVDFVLKAAFTPFVAPYGVRVNDVVANADMLLLPGGIDVDPAYYGYENFRSESVDPEKDAFERSLYRAFIAAKKPIFGICRGFQLIAMEHLFWDNHSDASMLTSFLQHVSGHNGPEQLATGRGIRTQLIFNNGEGVNRAENIQEAIYGAVDSPWSGATFDHSMFVNSMHHQGLSIKRDAAAVDYTVCGMRMLAFSTRGMKPAEEGGKNILVEAFEIPSLKIKAVQWHPEELGEFLMLRRHYDRYAATNTPAVFGQKHIPAPPNTKKVRA